MSDGANASAKLSTSIPDASVLTDLVGQLKNGVGGVKAPDIPTDKIQESHRWAQHPTPRHVELAYGHSIGRQKPD